MDYKDYQHLVFERRPHGVLLITINRPEVLNATNDRLHWELTQIWLTLDRDPDTRVAVETGAGRAFSAGGSRRNGVKKVPRTCTAGRSGRVAAHSAANRGHPDKTLVPVGSRASVGGA